MSSQAEYYKPIYANRESQWEPSLSSVDEETEFRLQHRAEVIATLTGTDPGEFNLTMEDFFKGEQDDVLLDDRTDAGEVGVAAQLWIRPGSQGGLDDPDAVRILHFRGSSSDMDMYNIRFTYGHWVLERSRERFMELYEDEAGLPIEDRDAHKGFVADFADFLVRLEFSMRVRTLKQKLWEAMEEHQDDDDDIDREDIARFAQWPVTRAIIRDVAPVERDLETEQPLFFTGYSQGGMRATQAALFLAKEDGVRYNTTTLAATGFQCGPRTLWGASKDDDESQLAQFFDIYTDHSDHITTYHDVFDPYAAIDYAHSRRCVYGVTGAELRSAAKYCKDVLGYNLAGGTGLLNVAVLRRCLYFTHSSLAIGVNLRNATFLADDGTTDGGCATVPIIPKEDPDELCPKAVAPGSFIGIVFLVIVLPSLIIASLLCCCIRVVWLACCCRRDPVRGADGKPVLRSGCCGCCTFDPRDSLFPESCLCCNQAPSHPPRPTSCVTCPDSDAGVCNRACCFVGSPCLYCGIPCCPPFFDRYQGAQPPVKMVRVQHV